MSLRRSAFLLALLAASSAATARAEVGVDRLGNGKLRVIFEPGPTGPWDRVSGRAAADVLNELGDSKGDGWPWVRRNGATGKPEAAWGTGGSASEIYFSVHDGTRWVPYRNLSRHPAHESMPSAAADPTGNRFVAWIRSEGGANSVVATCLAADDSCQAPAFTLSERQVGPRRPSVAVNHVDGLAYVAYEEHRETGPDAGTYVIVDRLTAWKYPNGILWCGGEDTIDVARVLDVRTHQTSSKAPCDVRMNAEQGHVWVTWIDEPGVVGFSELDGGAFTAPGYVAFTAPGGDEAVREQVRTEVLR